MLTLFRNDLKGELFLRKGELKNLEKERDQYISIGVHNPFKKRVSRDLEENIRLCRTEIKKIEDKLKNNSI